MCQGTTGAVFRQAVVHPRFAGCSGVAQRALFKQQIYTHDFLMHAGGRSSKDFLQGAAKRLRRSTICVLRTTTWPQPA